MKKIIALLILSSSLLNGMIEDVENMIEFKMEYNWKESEYLTKQLIDGIIFIHEYETPRDLLNDILNHENDIKHFDDLNFSSLTDRKKDFHTEEYMRVLHARDRSRALKKKLI